jgi:hypothetical protein
MTYPTFDDVEDRAVRAYNRVAVAHNIHQDVSEEKAKEYLAKFPARDKMEVMAMIAQIIAKGREVVKKQVFKEETIH